jgi:hypothetical protein
VLMLNSKGATAGPGGCFITLAEYIHLSGLFARILQMQS